MNNKFYITSAIPYVNAKPHVGHALEFVQADTIARFHKLLDNDVLLLCGGDENAIKNVQAAEAAGIELQKFIDDNTESFLELSKKLSVQFDIFQKGSNPAHHISSQKLWELCNNNGDIYKKSYSGLYCVGCELFYEREELNENGECYEHPGKKLEEVTEENYFFKLSAYEKEILQLLENDTIQITPLERKNEAVAFVKSGLKDISISRSNARARNWGVPVPGDPNQRMYVWFDALNIYRSGIGADQHDSSDSKKRIFSQKDYEHWWPADVHVIGKGIIRFHAIYWPAFLLSAGLKIPKSLFVHGYFTVNGQKMSKTLGNVIDPIEMIEKYGVDALRYYFLHEIPSTADGDFSEEKLQKVYTSDLANGLGNLVSRVARLCEKASYNNTFQPTLDSQVLSYLEKYEFNLALDRVWELIRETDRKINEDEPWKITDITVLTKKLSDYVHAILTVAYNLQPFLPNAAEKILHQYSGKIESQNPLFPRLS